MILWLGLLLCLTLWGASFRRDGIAAYYISRDGTNAVRGVFILLILSMHFTQYVSASADPAVTAFWAVRRFFDQLAVCMFLFYSGYGVALSFAEKGEGYRKSFLQKRMLPTLMAYDVSVLLFILIECTVGEGCSFGYCLRALLAWESMGNDNWYIFVILGLYGISWLSACVQVRCFGKISAAWMIGGVTLGTAAFALFLSAAGRREFWYNTIVCFPFGVLFCYVRSRAERALEKPLPYWVSLFAVLGLFLLLNGTLRQRHVLLYMLTALSFAALVLLVTMKLSVRNRLLILAGEHLNALFLVHRIPMRLLGEIRAVRERVYLYFALSVACAIGCAWLFEKLLALLRRKKPARGQ